MSRPLTPTFSQVHGWGTLELILKALPNPSNLVRNLVPNFLASLKPHGNAASKSSQNIAIALFVAKCFVLFRPQ